MIPACPRPSVSRCSTGWSPRSRSSASWWAASPSWPGASQAPARTARSTCTRWPRRPGGGQAGLAEDGVRGRSRAVRSLRSAPRLQVAIRNLLDNAAKFGPPDDPVEVSLRFRRTHRTRSRAGYRGRRPAARFRPLLPACRPGACPAPASGWPCVRQVAESHGGTVQRSRRRRRHPPATPPAPAPAPASAPASAPRRPLSRPRPGVRPDRSAR